MDKPKVGIFTFEQFHGRKNIGSSMIRAKWLLPYWEGAELFKSSQKYDVVIFQKVYYKEWAEMVDCIKILDLCDPDWYEWGTRLVEMIDKVDAITCATQPIAEYVTKLTDKPVWLIPDRVDLQQFKERKNHQGNGATKSVVWYGYSHNFEALESALMAIAKLGLDIIIVSNKPYAAPREITSKVNVTNYPWSDEHWQDDIMRGDVVINPRPENNKWKFKSNNKTLNAWALGMPVAHTKEELEQLLTEEQRIAESNKRLAELRENWQVEKSVWEYKKLISELWITKNSKKE